MASLPVPSAKASKLPPSVDAAWESMGGGPSDLYFPDSFLGEWDITSELTSVEKLMGDEFIPNPAAVERAINEDLNRHTRYKVSFVRGPNDKVIFDRRFNTATLVGMYYPGTHRLQRAHRTDFNERIVWNMADPNVLLLSLPGGTSIRTRVTRRSATTPADDRLETSEFFEQIFDDAQNPPRLKANQCFTKFKWRDEAVAAKQGGPSIVATQLLCIAHTRL
ncbi:hypothetical protein FOA52_001104 [Chlamydomonas sp. UWO 241]|nr:hypothetical protein FOA52_001104 [Chlamydomonas sp. UWO 241]